MAADGNDTLNGGFSADMMYGGNGNDTHAVYNIDDRVFENAGEGTNTVRTTPNSYTLPANVENLVFAGTGNFTGNGNGLNNAITGATATTR